MIRKFEKKKGRRIDIKGKIANIILLPLFIRL